MGLMSNFKIPKIDIPKIDTSVLPSASDFGINTGEINSTISDIAGKFNLKDGLDLSSYPNPKDKAVALLNKVPKIGNFSIMSVIPQDMLNKIDTNEMSKKINGYLNGIDLGEFGTLKLPDDIGSLANDVISGKGIDFSSLYSMPAIETPSFSIGNDFNLDEMTTEINTIADISSSEFNIDQYLKEYSDISF